MVGTLKHFRRLCQGDNVVDDHRRLVAVQVGELASLMASSTAPVEFRNNIENIVDAKKYRGTVVLLLKPIIEELSSAPFQTSLFCA